jgi:hypothetical protein
MSREKTLNHCQLFTPFKTRSDHPDRNCDGFISMGHGRAIINIEDLDIQTDIYQRIVSQNLSVRYGSFSKNYQESLNRNQ